MRYRIVVLTALLAASVTARATLAGVEQALPVKNGRPVVATVNSDAIPLDVFVAELGPSADRARLLQGRATADEMTLLDRLVTIKLVVAEAAAMGIDETPELNKQLEVRSRELLREVLFERLLKDVKPDPAAVEKLFRESVREWKTTALLFKDEAAAARAQKELAAGAAFADVASRAVAAKAAKADGDSTYHTKKDYLPEIAAAVAKLQPGQVSPVIKIQAGFVIVKVLDIRYPENADARAEARARALNAQQQVVLNAHDQAMRRQYVVINKAVLNGLDFTAAKPGIDALLKDKRVVAEIKGAAPITVGDLTDYLRMQFFHGTDREAQRKRMNEKKDDALTATLVRRLLNMEALKLGLDKTNAYRDRMTSEKESLIFEMFMKKVIAPGNQMREDEVKKYYNAHLKDYSYPEMVRVRSLAFSRRAAAEDAARKLKQGTDLNWLAANAEGQVAKGTAGLLVFDGQPLTTSSLPDAVQKALAGGKAGESRLYASPEGYVYVLVVQKVIAATAKPYEEVREEIAKKLYGEKLNRSLQEYTGKLRARSKVETYLKRMQ